MKIICVYINFRIKDSINYITISTESDRKLRNLDSLLSSFVICDMAELSILFPLTCVNCC